MNDRRGNPSKPSHVFKSSKLKAQFALNMDCATSKNKLSEEFCFFDGKVKRCRGLVSLTASVYHPVLKKLIPLATMECEGENSNTVQLFWECFNEILRKESGNNDYQFNPRGWITDMAGSNIEGLKRVFGSDVVGRIKSCEFHFKECRNRQSRKLGDEDRSNFKRLCNRLLQAPSPVSYTKAKEDLESFIAECPERIRLSTWLDWWHKRRAFVFPAFVSVSGGPKMNLAEVIHASWVKRDQGNMSLLDAAQADARDNVQLEVEYKAFCAGDSRGGTGPSLQDKALQKTSNEVRRAHALGQELTREDITDTERTASPTAFTAPFSLPSDKHNASVTSSCERTTCTDRPSRYRSSRSKAFLDRLERAKREKNTIKVRSMNIRGQETPGLVCALSTSRYTDYTVHIGSQHSCDCQDYAKQRGKQACKHILWTLLFICGIQENSEILQQVSLTITEIRHITANTPTNIPEQFKIRDEATTPTQHLQSRKEVTTNLLENDPRNASPQIWYLERKEKKRGQVPRCRGCQAEQQDGELCLSVTGLYVPYEQNFVVETSFYFCPSTSCMNRLPPWTNLRKPHTIHVKTTVSDEDISKLGLQQISFLKCNA
jgi:predicted nucleic acid-binding Zn finger protein